MTYPEALQYLASFINYERLDTYDYKKSFKLDRMKRLTELLGNPEKGLKAVHIAGSKGKGSTAAMVHSILTASNFRVGLYTSPHLVSFRERIRIGDELISEDETCEFLEEVKYRVDCLEGERPSFFEVYTALAYLYFRAKRVDFAVYETGLGGRLDATNIIEPLVCGLTPISYEHTQRLGNTLREIAGEKAGIIKEGITCVSAPQEKEALEVIEETCRKKGARFVLVGRDIFFEGLNSDDTKTRFNILGLAEEYAMLETGLIGRHQMVNAATAVGIIEALAFNGIKISADAIRTGLNAARWDGRLEIVKRSPSIVLDGAQNIASARALADAIREVFDYKRLILVLGVSKDKDIKGILGELLPFADSAILTKSNIAERAMEPSRIRDEMPLGNLRQERTIMTSNVKEALDVASAHARRDDLILVTGSLFVIGEAREYLLAKKGLEVCEGAA